MKKIKVGIIGMGYIGESHIEAIRRIGCCELYAIADTNAELAREKAEYYGIEKCYLNVEDLLADPEIDAVHNCTPNFLHLSINKEKSAHYWMVSRLPFLAAAATSPPSATMARKFGMTISWLNISESSQARSLDTQEPRKMSATAMTE